MTHGWHLGCFLSLLKCTLFIFFPVSRVGIPTLSQKLHAGVFGESATAFGMMTKMLRARSPWQHERMSTWSMYPELQLSLPIAMEPWFRELQP
mmetsp:Transcript_2557/g.4338  ORF Transcript_2557/g.4338 Transcript_2557/m.4338 type:complete len:93 (+) Transcript_2557:1303-1581(+)